MSELHWTPEVGESHNEHELAEALRIAARHRRLFRRLLSILAEDGWLARDGEDWIVRRRFPVVDPDGEIARLIAEFPTGVSELELTGRAGHALAGALRGEVDPLQLLFPDGSSDATERLYRDSPPAKFYNGLIAEIVSRAANAADRRQTLRILEIGGGTGGTTAHVLPRLTATGVEYTFTDVGPLFVSRARERFGAKPAVRFEVLDLERDPAAQGFGSQRFDMIIASNVIHATADLEATLGRVRQLIAPGGVLAMLEVTAPQRWFDLTVGLTPGWWLFSDSALRPDYPTLSRDRWLTTLSKCGFDSTVALPGARDRSGVLGLQSLFLARSSAAPAPVAGTEWLLHADESGVAAALAARLRDRGDTCTLVRTGTEFERRENVCTVNPTSADDYRRLLTELRSAGRTVGGVVHAWSLDAPREDAAADFADSGFVFSNVGSARALAQALAAEAALARLWFLTRGAQQADAADHPLSPSQAAVWGFGRTLTAEHPELRSVCVDLDPAGNPGDPVELGALIAELDAMGDEAQVALRGGARRVARLMHAPRASRADSARAPYRLARSSAGGLDGLALTPLERRAPGPGRGRDRGRSDGTQLQGRPERPRYLPGRCRPTRR